LTRFLLPFHPYIICFLLPNGIRMIGKYSF
jgi:hypothetical protein